jgi:hypothetical protein
LGTLGEKDQLIAADNRGVGSGGINKRSRSTELHTIDIVLDGHALNRNAPIKVDARHIRANLPLDCRGLLKQVVVRLSEACDLARSTEHSADRNEHNE